MYEKVFRSNYEIKFVKALKHLEVKWVYEPFSVELPDKSRYVPDFLIGGRKQYSFFCEVKGLWTSEGKKKFLKFVKQYPQYPIFIADLELIRMVDHKERPS
jgi:hypothetical protein